MGAAQRMLDRVDRGSVSVLNASCEAITIADFTAWVTRRCSTSRPDRACGP